MALLLRRCAASWVIFLGFAQAFNLPTHHHPTQAAPWVRSAWSGRRTACVHPYVASQSVVKPWTSPCACARAPRIQCLRAWRGERPNVQHPEHDDPPAAESIAPRRPGASAASAVRAPGRSKKVWSARAWASRAVACAVALLSTTSLRRGRALAAAGAGGAVGGGAGVSATAAAGIPRAFQSLTGAAVLWACLFIFSSSLHAAEISITTLYPWKVREFAEEEGPKSPFQTLNSDITRVLTTVLVLTTVCQVVSTVLFTTIIGKISSIGFAKATTILTLFTLFFGELLPKALGVSNAELVARAMVPVISVFAVVFSPMGMTASWLTKKVLQLMGLKVDDDGRVSEEELRLIVMGAKQSGGIEKEEAKMVEGVLDLQDTRVSEVMKPRVDVEALEANATLMDLLQLVNTTHYSRIPIYDGEIDRIIGVTMAKDLLKYAADPDALRTVTVAELMESTYFVPESMVVQRVLEEMRRRRLHMAIVVDEYGGTAGVVTLEDILEEVVGEIYDEGDDMEETEDEDNIIMIGEGVFELRGIADLDDVCLALNMTLPEEDQRDFGTISGFLCDQAGEIPTVGDCLLVSEYAFTITDADERRILAVQAEAIMNLTETQSQRLRPTRSFFNRGVAGFAVEASSARNGELASDVDYELGMEEKDDDVLGGASAMFFDENSVGLGAGDRNRRTNMADESEGVVSGGGNAPVPGAPGGGFNDGVGRDSSWEDDAHDGVLHP